MIELPKVSAVTLRGRVVEADADPLPKRAPDLQPDLPEPNAVALARQSETRVHRNTGVAAGSWLSVQGPTTARSRLMELATREPYCPEALLMELRRDPSFAALFDGSNTTGESLAEHSLAVAVQAEQNLRAQPITRRTLQPFLGLFRIKMLLHDIGKPVTLQRDGNSVEQYQDTIQVLRSRLAVIGFARAEIEFLGNQIKGTVRDGATGLRDLAAGERTRRQCHRLDLRECVPLNVVMLMRLSLFIADASYYPKVRSKVFVAGVDGVFRVRPDVPEASLSARLRRVFHDFPVDEFFAADRRCCSPASEARPAGGGDNLEAATVMARVLLGGVLHEDGTSYLAAQLATAEFANETLGHGGHGGDVASAVLVRALLEARGGVEGIAAAWDNLPQAPEVVSTAASLMAETFDDDARVTGQETAKLARAVAEVLATRRAVLSHGRLAADVALVVHLGKLVHHARVATMPGSWRGHLADSLARALAVRVEAAAAASPEMLVAFDREVERVEAQLRELGGDGGDVEQRHDWLQRGLEI